MKDMSDTKKYTNLEKQNINTDLLNEIAQAHMEIRQCEDRISYLKALISHHDNLSGMLWRTRNGDIIPVPLLTDEHLKNIVSHLLVSDREIPTQVYIEYVKRFGESMVEMRLIEGGSQEAEIVDDSEDRDLPF